MEILAIVIVAAYFLIVARKPDFWGKFGIKSPLRPPKKRTRPAKRSPYRATSISSQGGGCSAVNALKNVRFLDLGKAKPSIPVLGCDATSCNCKLTYHADRREIQDDRRPPTSLVSELFEGTGNVNRRQARRGRRDSDWA